MKILTVKEAGELLEVDAKTVYRLIERRQLPAFRVGRQWRMRLSDIEVWIDGQLRAREAAPAYGLRQSLLIPERTQGADEGEAGKAAFSDSAFSENNNVPIHRWVPWIAGFSARFVSEVLDRYLVPHRAAAEQTVLDPFAGVGTALVTAMLRGHSVYGFEINPYAAEACELKLSIDDVPVVELARSLEEFKCSVKQVVRGETKPKSRPPSGFNTRNTFLSPQVERKVLLVQDFIAALENSLVRKCFRLALASELVGFSNYSYEPSLSTRAAAGKQDVVDAPVLRKVERKVQYMLEDVKAAQKKLADRKAAAKVNFQGGDFFQLERMLPEAGIDLVITSPPYLNNYHYIRNTRPQVYWLGLAASPKDLKEVEQGSFGKYWQTVRGGEDIRLAFSMPDLEKTIEFLRRRNITKGQYGGPGWANYASTYFNDCHRFAQVLRRILRPGGKAVVVLGNSILQGVEFKTDRFFGRICEACGLVLEDIQLLRTKRTGTSIINSSVRASAVSKRTTLYESAVIVAKQS